MNLFALIVLLFLIGKMAQGYKRGMVKEVISLISLIILCVVAVLIGSGLQSYGEHQYVGVAVAVILLILVAVVHSVLGVFFFSAKVIAKLPVIHWADKLLGLVTGALETILLLWTLYTFLITFGMGDIGTQILAWTQENPVLAWLYNNNYLAVWLCSIRENIDFIQLWEG